MCFNRNGARLRIATGPIRCYKHLEPGVLVSQITRFQYKLGTTYRSFKNWRTLLEAGLIGLDGIEHGFHSIDRPKRNEWGGQVVECTIPVGALYYKDTESGYLVSSSIRIDRTVPDYEAQEIELGSARPVHRLK